MDDETQKIIAEQMKMLPKDVVDAILSVDYKTRLQEITRRQRLLIDQAGKLETETTLILMGLEPLDGYMGNLQKQLGVSFLRAKEISMDVSENIFKPIRQSLYEMNKEGEEGVVMPGNVTDQEKAGPVIDEKLDREQMLNQIEDPSLTGKSTITSFSKAVTPTNTTSREIETLDEVPYQQDIKVKPEDKPSVVEAKITGPTFVSQQIINAAPEIKLPAVEKKRPSSGFDPYREEIK